MMSNLNKTNYFFFPRLRKSRRQCDCIRRTTPATPTPFHEVLKPLADVVTEAYSSTSAIHTDKHRSNPLPLSLEHAQPPLRSMKA
ncbi:hypothetical protein KEM48_010781 [Puccinia striiformis f. sp. tritici PST-130]|nr:hypothetical protein KEM48_010781 [Puccinia striiformis f. sp. tritici PST-130]